MSYRARTGRPLITLSYHLPTIDRHLIPLTTAGAAAKPQKKPGTTRREGEARGMISQVLAEENGGGARAALLRGVKR